MHTPPTHPRLGPLPLTPPPRRPAHPYEGEGVGRRESLKGEELPPVPHGHEQEGAAPPQGGATQ